MSDGAWVSSEQAARRLGVKPETVYAYVSRGLIRSEREPGTRRSRFLRADVERHAARSRRGGRAGALEVVVESELTLLEPDGHLYFRGWDVGDAVESSCFEAVATWLWTGEADPSPFIAPERALAAARPIIAQVAELPLVDRWRTVLSPIRHSDALRADRRASAVALVGRQLIATLVDCLPVLGTAPDPEAPLAHRLWPRITAAPPSASRLRILDAILILMADHELATSTLGARVAASTSADPYLVVEAGLAILGGPRHGGASDQAKQLLLAAGADGQNAATAIGDVLSAGRYIPGFGHSVYERNDPRADLLLALLDDAGDTPPATPAILSITEERALPFPNVDFALASIAIAYDFVEGATQAVVAASRIAGWLAHAIEEYPHGLRFRTRAAYVGPKPT